jgi:hypothetical protein
MTDKRVHLGYDLLAQWVIDNDRLKVINVVIQYLDIDHEDNT